MTEQEAKEKWCPMARALYTYNSLPSSDIAGWNRGDSIEINCIASACMMWRDEKGKPLKSDNGYCGLGGKP